MDKKSEREKELHNKKVRIPPFDVEDISEAPSPEITDILEELGIDSVVSIEEIQGGQDSQVFKVEGLGDSYYALRLMPFQYYEQFIEEKKKMDIDSANGIPVPKVLAIKVVSGYAAMLIEWGEDEALIQKWVAKWLDESSK